MPSACSVLYYLWPVRAVFYHIISNGTIFGKNWTQNVFIFLILPQTFLIPRRIGEI